MTNASVFSRKQHCRPPILLLSYILQWKPRWTAIWLRRFSVRFQFSICCILRWRTDWVPINFWQDGTAWRKEARNDCWRYTDRWVFFISYCYIKYLASPASFIYLQFSSFTEQFTLNECLNTGVLLFPLDRHQHLWGQCGRLNRPTTVWRHADSATNWKTQQRRLRKVTETNKTI